MRTLLLASTLVFAAVGTVSADAIPGDDECPPGQSWRGGHDGECGCSVSPGSQRSQLPWLVGLGALGVVALRRR